MTLPAEFEQWLQKHDPDRRDLSDGRVAQLVAVDRKLAPQPIPPLRMKTPDTAWEWFAVGVVLFLLFCAVMYAMLHEVAQ